MLSTLLPALCLAQSPAGSIAGIVRDAAGGAVSRAQVQAVSRATGQVRTAATGEQGEYSFPGVTPGAYDVSVEAAGFKRTLRTTIVDAGTTTRSDLVLRPGEVSESVTVEAASPQLHYDSAAVNGLITHDQIRELPLNGRNFLDLARLEPGIEPPTGANRNRTIVSILGAPAANVGGARFTVDGGSITSIGLGGAQMALSQEQVQEFQVSTVNYDLAAGMTDSGALNVVTRAGGNDLQVTTFYFFRDHHLAAYPVLTRDPFNPNPFFQRQQFGFAVGGPIRRNRAFYFGNWERNDQRAVAATTLLAPDFAHLSRITTNPLSGTLFSARLDGKITSAHTVFVRHSHDGSRAFGPAAAITGGSPNAYPSNWNRLATRAHQSLVGLTSVLRATLINDLRFSYFGVRSDMSPPREQECAGCLGLGAPSITVAQAGLVIGNSTAIDGLARRFHLNNSTTWLLGPHRVRFGIDWEHNRDRNFAWSNEPVSITLFAPARVRAYNAQPGLVADQRIPLPATFRTLDDILRLPLQSMSVGVGEPGVPQANGGSVRRWNTLWLYAEDAWRLHKRVTLTYGLGWGYDGILNHDLRKPLLLAPLLGADRLGPTKNNWTNFSPVAGVIWTPASDGKTVVRVAAGRFYRPHGLPGTMDVERVALGPPGLGRQSFGGSSILNPLRNIPGVPAGTPLDFRTGPTLFTGANLMAILPAIRADLAESLASGDQTMQQIQISKQSSPAIFPERVSNPAAVHVNAGFQREITRGMVVSADLVYRRFVHVPAGGGSIDVNHFTSARGPVIPECTGAQANDPGALCSRGSISVQVAPYHFSYKGLLVRADKRFSRRFQALASYAYSKHTGTNIGTGFNLDDWLENTGPAANHNTHVVNLSGVLGLPSLVNLGFNFSYASVAPFSAFVGGIDFNGDGTSGDLLPGTTSNAFNRGMGRADLERLVTEFNETYAGTKDAQGVSIPSLTLPADYSLGDSSHSLDLRLSRSFLIRRIRVLLIGEAFNVYNASNLSGYSGDLTTTAFGQPTARVTQVFGSGGPRSFQVAVRVSF